MSGTRYTAEQRGAIDETRPDILVSASAGSGKTTVMTERVCRLLRDSVPLGAMVVCTFTNAAAADMRKKLTVKLTHAAHEPWAAAALREMPLAEITTIDSFCARLCRNYFYYTNLDPMFEVLDQTAAGLYLAESFDEVFLKRFESGDEGFLRLLAIFSQSRSDRRLQELVMRLLNFSSIQPEPDTWLDAAVAQADKHEEHLAEIRLWDDLVADKRDALAAHDSAKTTVHLRALIDLTRAVRDVYAAKKQKKAALDFCDVEHAALKILLDDAGGAAVRERFRYLFVDEFQDVNPLQEAIFSALTQDARAGKQTASRFYVGDVKQSIYRFRLSDPAIFMRKRESATMRYRADAEQSDARSFLFPHNFRSEKGILKFCDRVFTGLMTQEFGGTDYEKEAFVAGANVSFCVPLVCNLVRPAARSKSDTEQAEEAAQKTSLPIYSVKHHAFCEDAETDLKQAEANWIAEHIAGLIGQPIEERVGGETVKRSVTYRDIAVLTRSGGSFTQCLLQTLTRAAIPAWVEKESAPEENPAVCALIAHLKLVENRRDDIALATVLKGAAGGFCTDSDLARIRLHADNAQSDSDMPFWAACGFYLESGADKKLCNALCKLEDGLTRYETLSQVYGFSELAGMIAAECDAFHYALACGGSSVADGLAQFLDNLPVGMTLKEGLAAIGAGAVMLCAPREADAVRIMTIHASKGLEFPFVILANLEKRYNTDDLRRDCILDAELGAALKFFDETEGKVHKTSLWHRAERVAMKQQAEEELRILYVGLTRAIYQTALFAAVSSSYRQRHGLDAVCPLDFLYDAMLPHLCEREPSACPAPPAPAPVKFVYGTPHGETVRAFRAYTDFAYPHDSTPVKTTVTRLSREHAMDDAVHAYASYAEPQHEDGMRVGDAYHKFLEVYDYQKPFGENFAAFRHHYPDFAKLVDEKRVRSAAEKIGARIAGRAFYRELPFLYSDGGMFVQGVIDLLIDAPDGAEIIDYKTGKLTPARFEAYQKQVELYARAVQNTLNKRVLRKSVFLLHTSEFLNM